MNIKYKEAANEVIQIINLLEEQEKNKIPPKILSLLEYMKIKDYNKKIYSDIPLEEQNISAEAKAILAFLLTYMK